jgi:hypothetical protein
MNQIIAVGCDVVTVQHVWGQAKSVLMCNRRHCCVRPSNLRPCPCVTLAQSYDSLRIPLNIHLLQLHLHGWLWADKQPRPRLLAQAFLTDLPTGVELRSVAVRRAEVTAGVFLCSLVRDGLRCAVACDGVMMDAGSIRRNHVYPPGYAQFTYGDLKKVTPPPRSPHIPHQQPC